jgi:hypothetical protein
MPPFITSRDFGDLETTAVNQDFLVELRGFEPLTSAEQAPVRGDGAGLILPRARPGSLLFDRSSLFLRINSLFCFLGNFPATHCSEYRIQDKIEGGSPFLDKSPCSFPC